MIEGVLCGSDGFNRYFTLQAYLLTFLGPMLTLLGICICCQTRLADRDKHKRKVGAQGKETSDLTIEDLNGEEKNVEMNELKL